MSATVGQRVPVGKRADRVVAILQRGHGGQDGIDAAILQIRQIARQQARIHQRHGSIQIEGIAV
jgi:hypothetical protein